MINDALLAKIGLAICLFSLAIGVGLTFLERMKQGGSQPPRRR